MGSQLIIKLVSTSQTIITFKVNIRVNVQNNPGLIYKYTLYDSSAIQTVTAATIETEFKQYLTYNNLNVLDDTPITTKSILAFWNAAAAFFSNKLSYAVSMLNTSKKPIMYLSDSRINRIIADSNQGLLEPAEKINIEPGRLSTNIPHMPLYIVPSSDVDLGSDIQSADRNVDLTTKALLAQINAYTKVKTMAYKFVMHSSCCSSSSCSSSCSSSSSSMYIAYKKL